MGVHIPEDVILPVQKSAEKSQDFPRKAGNAKNIWQWCRDKKKYG